MVSEDSVDEFCQEKQSFIEVQFSCWKFQFSSCWVPGCGRSGDEAVGGWRGTRPE